MVVLAGEVLFGRQGAPAEDDDAVKITEPAVLDGIADGRELPRLESQRFGSRNRKPVRHDARSLAAGPGAVKQRR